MTMLSVMHRDLTPELIKQAEEELGETEEIRIQKIKELKELIKEEPDFNPCTEDAFLTRFLRARKFDTERSFKTLKHYYTFKAQNSGVLTDLDPSEFLQNIDRIQASVLDHRDQNQCIIGFIRLGQIDTNIFSPQNVLGLAILATEVLLESEPTQVAGYCFIVDVAGFSLRKARHYASPTFLYNLVSVIQDCYPSRMKAFHIVNEPFYFDIIYSTLQPFLSEKLRKRVHFHGSNLNSLYKFVNRKWLPEELGGDQGPSEIIEKKLIALICEHEEYLKRMHKFGYTGNTLQKLKKGK